MGFFNFFKKNKNDNEKQQALNEELDNDSLKQEVVESEEQDSEIEETNVEKEITAKEIIERDFEAIKEEIEPLISDIKNVIDEKKIEVDEKAEQKIINEKNFEADTIEASETEIEASEKAEELKKEINAEEQHTKTKKSFFEKIKSGLTKTRSNILNNVEQILKGFAKIDEELFEELEEALIMSDIGVETSMKIIEDVRLLVKKEKVTGVAEVKKCIIKVITQMLEEGNDAFELETPSVILVIGVNGVGKTTTIGKLTHNFKLQNKKVLLAAADTFRAAAIDQLQIWGERSGVDVIKHQENSDPAAVVFDAVQAAKARKTDILICDTAGRLHNKKNLMEELRKISRVIEREYPEAKTEVLLVLDATTGQNALQQAKLFKEVADITGIVLTKLDGTAKGGIVIAIKNELKIPVRFVGVGEGIDDLQNFNSEDFARALFAE